MSALPAAVALSALGMAVHTVREFGWTGLVVPATGLIPVVAIQLALLAWAMLPKRRSGTAVRWLMYTGIVQLLGGAIFSVLPLPILPFVPEQSLDHYVSHAVYGIAQLPLIVVALREAAARFPSLR